MSDTQVLEKQLGDMLWIMATALRSGYSLRQIFEKLAADAPEPTAGACQRLVADLDAGRSYDEALSNIHAIWPSPYLAQVIVTMQRHRQTGGNLADRLDPVSEDVLARVGSDGAFYPHMRDLAQAVHASLPGRARED